MFRYLFFNLCLRSIPFENRKLISKLVGDEKDIHCENEVIDYSIMNLSMDYNVLVAF